jgi:aquaporin Z
MTNYKQLAAEFIGTLWLVLGGCGAAVFAAQFMGGTPQVNLGIGLLGVSLAFGLTVVTGAYALGHASGGHFNPAVTLGLLAARKFPAAKVAPYVGAQVLGGFVGGLLIYIIAEGRSGFTINDAAGTFATNGYGDHSPAGYSLAAVLLAETLLTAIFLLVILGATARRATPAMAGLTIGLTLTLIHLISIPISNTSVNPARSTAQAVVTALFGHSSTTPLKQLWLFWLAPLLGAAIGGLVHRYVLDSDDEPEPLIAAQTASAAAA